MSFTDPDAAAPRHLGVRFDAAGRALPCGGSTVIAHVDDAARAALTAARDRLAASPVGGCVAWLPPSSYHMTICDLLLHDRRAPGFWPEALTREASPTDADRFALDALRGAPGAAAFRMRPGAIGASGGGVGVTMTAADAAEERRLRACRSDLAARIGLADRPGEATYRFHVTLGYIIAAPGRDAAHAGDAAAAQAAEALARACPEMALGPPELCLFADMTAFRRQALLDSGC